MAKLTDKQERFAVEYIKTLNATQSAINAGYSPKTAYSIGNKLLKKDEIAEFIRGQKQKILDEGILEARELLYLMSKAATGQETETKEVVVKRGEYVRNPDTDRLNVIYNEHVEMVDVPVKVSDRNKAREMLGKYHKLFTERHEVSTGTTMFVTVGDNKKQAEQEIEKLQRQNPNGFMFIDDLEE